MKKTKAYQLILITFLLVIAAVVGTRAYSRWVANHTVPGPGSLEGRLQGVGDWAEGEQGLELLGVYTFVATEEIDPARIKKYMPISFRMALFTAGFPINRSSRRISGRKRVLCPAPMPTTSRCCWKQRRSIGKRTCFWDTMV